LSELLKESGPDEACPSHREEQFLSLLLRSQPNLRAYIASLLLDRSSVDDLLQEVNLTLLRKAETYRPQSSFMAWAARVAQLKVKEYQRKHSRHQRLFSPELIELISNRFLERYEKGGRDERLWTLHDCLAALPGRSRKLIADRYVHNASLEQLAVAMKTSKNAVSAHLYRIRLSLLDCIDRKTSAARHAT